MNYLKIRTEKKYFEFTLDVGSGIGFIEEEKSIIFAHKGAMVDMLRYEEVDEAKKEFNIILDTIGLAQSKAAELRRSAIAEPMVAGFNTGAKSKFKPEEMTMSDLREAASDMIAGISDKLAKSEDKSIYIDLRKKS